MWSDVVDTLFEFGSIAYDSMSGLVQTVTQPLRELPDTGGFMSDFLEWLSGTLGIGDMSLLELMLGTGVVVVLVVSLVKWIVPD